MIDKDNLVEGENNPSSGSAESKATAELNAAPDTLKERIEVAFKNHCEKDNGMIVGPGRLLDATLNAVADWLRHDEQQWGGVESNVSEALRDLRVNQLR